ncbi:CHASE2 domain-containing protein [Sulfitobacter sp. SK011]|uniref:CHASE2 domain-containing protein n=1 Tax=Sulfitobacter sp. SK011 TaxID=1389004 RepID=UPI000E0BB004|nr:adenylate/guanylate cyclase domain-containing protein [Sulfitobacter sp. SK011]AXI43424.1 adenylate/guanylate cyclase domain-containing protein [Sulfitobacter sp. SK011]
MTGKPAQGRGLILAGLACAALWAALVILPHISGRAGVIDGLENRLVDLRYALTGPRSASPDVVIVAIDDDTLAADTTGAMNGRDMLALLIRNIAQSGACALAVDILLAEPGDVDEDTALADALASLPSAIAAAAVFGADGDNSTGLISPQPIFHNAAQVGLVNLSTDAGGTPRYAPLLINIDGELRPSLTLLTAVAFTGEKAVFGETRLTLNKKHVPLDLGFNMPLRFSGPTGSVRTISARELLDALIPDALSGKVVVLGYSASAMGDRFPTPFDDSTPGVEIIATAISQLIGGPTLRRDAQVRIWDAGHAVGLTILCVFAILAWPLSRALPAAVAMMSISMILLTVIFSAGIWMSAALPLAAAIPPALVMGAMRYTQERQQANRSERTVASLRRFQAPALATKIEADPEYLATPIEQQLIIFFVDLTGFTGLSQKLGQGGTRNLLRAFHTLASDTIETRGGSVLNYMGDGALAVFGLDADASQQAADSALAAAFDLARTVSEHRLEELPDEHLGCRIGLHAGSATLSRMGVESHQQVTVTGDSVNLASRLMEVAKTEKAVIVASGDFFQALTRPVHKDTARQTEVPIRGRVGRVRVLVWTQDVIA